MTIIYLQYNPDVPTMVNTMAHEIGHNFGSDHDGADQIQYRSCTENRMGIMGGGSIKTNFSTCSLSAMHARLQKIMGDEEKDEGKKGGRKCFPSSPETRKDVKVKIKERDIGDHRADCPNLPPDECQDDLPDPPEIPEPPVEPECGDLEVAEPYEECDCGKDYLQCEDPCCYPAVISDSDIAANSSAKPCHRNKKEACINPYKSPVKFGLIFPFLFILLLILLLAIILWLDWRFGKRRLYFHITEREERRQEPLHVETEEQKERRVLRETSSKIRTGP